MADSSDTPPPTKHVPEDEPDVPGIPWSLELVKGLTQILTVAGLRVPIARIQPLRGEKWLKDHIFKGGLKLPNVVVDPKGDTGFRLLLLKGTVGTDLSGLPDVSRAKIKEEGFEVIPYTLEISYTSMSAVDTLRKIIPPNVETPSSFERVGHIAHLNLTENQLPYRYIIGRVVLEKNPGLRAVVNKKRSLHSKYRTLDLDLLAGEPDYVAEVQENGLRFLVDYANVYWNSRLSRERERLAKIIPANAVVVDLMAGVGAFALYLARKGCEVFANDLNPRAVDCVEVNKKRNKLQLKIRSSCCDARRFVHYIATDLRLLLPSTPVSLPLPLPGSARSAKKRERTLDTEEASTAIKRRKGDAAVESLKSADADAAILKEPKVQRTIEKIPMVTPPNSTLYPAESSVTASLPDSELHFVMNLPEIALEMLDALRGVARLCLGVESPEGQPRLRVLVVHCYCFAKEQTGEIQNRVKRSLGVWPQAASVYEVRDVAPYKKMYCVEFEVPSEVLWEKPVAIGTVDPESG